MALRERIKAKEEAEKAAAQVAEERKQLLLKRGLDRNLRNAYFHGLVVAAFANDDLERVDDAERSFLGDVGLQMSMSESMVLDAINRVSYLDDVPKMELVRESVGCLNRVETAEFFISEFTHIWSLGGGSEQGLADFLGDFDKWLPTDVAREVKCKREEAERKRLEEEKKRLEIAQKEAEEREKIAEFYNTVNTFYFSDDIVIAQLKEAKRYLTKEGYNIIPEDKLWVSIYKNYKDEVSGAVSCEVPEHVLNDKAKKPAFAAALATVAGAAACGPLGFAMSFVAWVLSNSLTSDSPQKQRFIRRRAVWALACLFAVKNDISETSLYPFNQLLKRVETVEWYSATDSNAFVAAGGDPFWKREVEPALCPWLGVPPV